MLIHKASQPSDAFYHAVLHDSQFSNARLQQGLIGNFLILPVIFYR
ncbi:hypothetical protein PANT111_560035 [Pantoea brenneri]|uniref:Uncharacterized protein n=1 Tax=Pantoea brenneri TaxID=472694 RepID=A0AAX3JC54_9GAMM|nr:hypothetical protein PANT111_560035 [Pantoea brenneri]